MKKWIAAVLCIMMLTGCALAGETVRVREMMLEGMPEQVNETLYQSGDGYELWYPSDYLAPGEQYGHVSFRPVGAEEENSVYFLIVPAQADPADAELLLNEAVGGFGPDAQISEVNWTTTEGGALLGAVQAAADGVCYRHYLVTDEDDELLLITACFPAEAAEGFGVRFDRMAETIAFAQIPLSARYEGDGFAISYPAELLQSGTRFSHDAFYPVEGGGESGVYLMIVKSDVASEHADALLNEAVGGYDNADAAKWSEEKALAGNVILRAVEIEQDGKIDRYYLLKGEEAVYCLTASFPAEGESDYGAAFDAMAESFEFTAEE